MKGKAVKILVISIASISVWELLRQLNILTINDSRLLWMLSIFAFIFSFYSLLTDFEFESKYFKTVIYFFLFYQLVTILRGLSFSSNDLKTIFRGPQIFWPFVIPLLVFFDKRFINIVSLIKTIYALGILFLILNVCFPSLLLVRLSAQYIIPAFALGCGFLLMNATYLSNKKLNISFLVILLSALSYTYLARRSAAFTVYGFLFSSYLLNTLNKSGKQIFKFFPLIIGIGIFLYFSPNKFSSALTEKISERLYEDTRTAFFKIFVADMDNYLTFGKGMNGTYYYPMEEKIHDDGIISRAVDYRNTIEIGYLQLLLTGGIINIILFVLILLPAAMIGIFKSSNQFTRACGIMIFLWLLDMFLFGLPMMSLHYVIIWICVGICCKASLREKTDVEIRNEFEKFGLP
jgi:hypothetical protein